MIYELIGASVEYLLTIFLYPLVILVPLYIIYRIVLDPSKK